MTLFGLVRFVATILRVHVTLLATAFLVLGMAAWMARNDPLEIGQMFTLALFVQMFSAASGFQQPARRGHFDPGLATGTSRAAVGAVHWGVSVAPGLLVWAALALLVFGIHPAERPTGLSPAALVAVLYVSSASWAVALPLTKYASGVVWLLVLFVLSGMNAIPTLREAFLAYPTGAVSSLRQAGAALVCPMFLMADSESVTPLALGAIVASTVLVVAAGMVFITRFDAPLQEPS